MRLSLTLKQRAERSYREKASLFPVLPGGLERLHIGLVAGDPCFDLRLRQVAHGQRHRRLQKKSAVALLDDDHRITDLIETQLAANFGRQGQAATFGEEKRCHAAMLHCRNAVSKPSVTIVFTGIGARRGLTPSIEDLRDEKNDSSFALILLPSAA